MCTWKLGCEKKPNGQALRDSTPPVSMVDIGVAHQYVIHEYENDRNDFRQGWHADQGKVFGIPIVSMCK
jgi:hypothetical protein